MKTIALLCLVIGLTGCASDRVIYRASAPLPIPAGILDPVQKPAKPDPQTATQKDVGIFLLEQNATIDYCNLRLGIIKNWSKKQYGYR